MAYHPDDMYINDSDKLYGCNKNVKFGGKWDSEMDTSKRRKSTQPTDDLSMFPKEDRDGNMGPMVVCTLIFATIATIGLLVFAYQYAK